VNVICVICVCVLRTNISHGPCDVEGDGYDLRGHELLVLLSLLLRLIFRVVLRPNLRIVDARCEGVIEGK
jgi:hypothetical protein